MSDQQPTPAFLDYITDEAFRRSLVSDYREMTAAIGTESWKAVLVLAGSLVEAILVDCLHGRTTDPVKRSEILKYDLGKAIPACKAAGILNDEAESLCTVARKFRNLIHPGRLVRMDQEVTRARGMVAANVVQVVAEAVAKVQKEAYGYTGEQILTKLTNDAEAFPALLPSLMAKVGDQEKERLVFKLLPGENFILRQYDETNDDPDGPSVLALLRNIRLCYTHLIEKASSDMKLRVVKHYLSVLLDGSELDRRYFEAGLLNECIGQVTEGADKDVIKNHLFEVLKRGASQELMDNTEWLGQWVVKDDFGRLTDAFLAPHTPSKANREAWIRRVYEEMGPNLCKEYEHHLQRVADWHEQEYGGSQAFARRIRELLAIDYIPF